MAKKSSEAHENPLKEFDYVVESISKPNHFSYRPKSIINRSEISFDSKNGDEPKSGTWKGLTTKL